jgi:hypothetical protein
MNAFDLERIRKETIDKLNLSKSSGQVLFIFYNYFNIILLNKNDLFISSYLKEFIEDYVTSLKSFDPFYQELIFTDHILEQSAKVSRLSQLGNYTEEINTARNKIKHRRDYLISLLQGKAENASAYTTGIYFPVLEDTKHLKNNITLGFAETLSITINKDPKAGEDTFMVIPSSELIEQNILEQIKISWQIAKKRAADYIPKLKCCHKVVLQFDNRTGDYIGDSLGAALAILFLRELLNYYDSAYQITAAGKIAVTGGITFEEKIKPVSDKIIQKKTAVIFYSDIQAFVVPNGEDIYVQEKLNALQKEFPARDIKIIEAKNLDDILYRRDLLDIKKRNLILRSGKIIKRNWVGAAVAILLTLFFSYLFILDFDNNPSSFSSDGTSLYVENAKGKVLWSKIVPIRTGTSSFKEIMRYARILDIDGDGKNEVILAGEYNKANGDPIDNFRVTCYSNVGDIIWKFSFADKVYSKREILNTDYSTYIIDTLTYSGVKNLFLSSSNLSSFSSAVYRIDLRTGKRLPGTFWASGSVQDCVIKYFDNIPYMIGAGYDNGYEDICSFAYKIDTLTKVRPTTDDYLIENFPLAKMKGYIRIPKTDFDIYSKVRTPTYSAGSLLFDNKMQKVEFSTLIPNHNKNFELGYEISSNFKAADIVVGSTFRVQRDTLVAHGILKRPFTDTEEYKDLIKSKILYWKDGKWVHRKDLN